MTDRLLSSATHVTFGAAAAERLAALGARAVVRSLDNLLLGPSRSDHAEHALVRKAWWGEGEEWDELSSSRAGRFDELLLTLLSAEWQTPVQVFVHESRAGAELQQLASCTGDLFVPQRLDQWVERGAVERAPGPRPAPGYPMLQSVHRITAQGVRLLKDGLGVLGAAPGLLVGGAEAYVSPWVVRGDGRIVRV